MPQPQDIETEVAIVGAGPSGLMLAIELGCRGVPCVLLETKPQPPTTPKANATSARTMEHYRRRGFAQRVRQAGLAPEHPQDVLYCTRLAGHELARFRIPSRAQVAERADFGDYGEQAWPTPELPHRVQQMHVEPILRDELARYPSVATRYGWTVGAVERQGDGVRLAATATADAAALAVRARYVVGCDGPRSLVRQAMGVGYEGASGEQRAFFGGQMLTLHIRSADLYQRFAGAALGRKAWQTWVVNPQQRGVVVAINGIDEFAVGVQLRPGETADSVQPAQVFRALAGAEPFGYELLHAGAWTAGYTLVAERFRQGTLFIAGDAAHLFTPTGGMGYNTSVDDAVNLGWKLAAVLADWAGEGLLDSYHDERHPIAQRNTRFARRMADSIGTLPVPPDLEDPGPAGAAARQALGDALMRHGASEFNIPGLQLGLRYASAVIAPEAGPPPLDDPNIYVPSGHAGARAPHLPVDGEGSSLFDRFGRDFTLLCLAPGVDVGRWQRAADRLGLPLAVVRLADAEARVLYGAECALVRPDHHIAWRGAAGTEPAAVLSRAVGRAIAFA